MWLWGLVVLTFYALTRRLDAPRGGVAMDVLTALAMLGVIGVLWAGLGMMVSWP